MYRRLQAVKNTIDTLTDNNTGLKIGGTKVISNSGAWVGNPTGLRGEKGDKGDTGATGIIPFA
ncbi:MAG: hypothetical protein HQK53_07165 [Oligoflexia bacterium]|nr:hypothetical protein [Oligoflexia bacterium]